MQGVNQQPASSATSGSLSTIAFLVQQLRQFSNSMSQQCHQTQPLQSSTLGFSLNVNGQEQAQAHQNHQQQHSQSMLLGGGYVGQETGGTRMGGMFQHLHQQGNMNSNLDQQQFGNQMMNPNCSENVSSQSMVEQNVQVIMGHLSMLQERIQQLQALVPLIAQTAHCQTNSSVVAQQQAASAAVVSIISQLAVAAIGILPQPFGNPGGEVNQSTELPLSQLLQAAVNPASNSFQRNALGGELRAPQRGISAGDLMNNIFATPAPVSGVNTGVNAGLRSFSGGEGGPAFPGLNNETDLSGQQNLSGQQAGGSSSTEAMSLHNQITSSVRKDSGIVGGGGSKTHGAVNPSNVVSSSLAPGSSANNVFYDLGGMGTDLEDLDNDSRVDDEDSDGENLPPGSIDDLVELNATEILAEHTHFCEICGKGFKRDANLRMHMRGHGDEYKTPAALARPDRGTEDTTVTRTRRFSCPYVGCKRNKKHRKFQPLKTMLCVKNHYRRSHCPKVLTCQKCLVKKFSVVADLKTHEKHCGRDKWLCSCGTTFSRKDKLFGHLGLFAGHTPAMAIHELESGGGGGGGNTPVEHQESPSEGLFGSKSKDFLSFSY